MDCNKCKHSDCIEESDCGVFKYHFICSINKIHLKYNHTNRTIAPYLNNHIIECHEFEKPMTIVNQKWFGVDHTIIRNKTTQSLRNLIFLFVDGIHKYFDLSDTDNMRDFIIDISNRKLKPGDILFVHWLNENINNLYFYVDKFLPENKLLCSQLEYDYFCLNKEVSMDYPEDLRSCLVDTINYLPGRLKEE